MVTPETASPDTLTLWNYLPQFAKDIDASVKGVDQIGNPSGQYQFLSWLEGAISGGSLNNTSASGLQELDNLCRDSEYGVGWSSVMDVSRCPTYALPWLAQFVGVRFSSTTIGDDSAMRLAILAESSFNRGTPAAIANAVAPYLGPGGFVQIIERYPTPYSFLVKIYGALGALTYGELAKKEGTYQAVATAYATYAAMDGSQSEATATSAVQNAVPGGLVVTVQFF